VDLDGDGTLDMVSGSYTKGVFFFKGTGIGKYDSPVNLKHTSGKIVSPDAALAPAFGDWDHDGDLDMVLGTISGPVYYLPNDGKMTFGNPVKMRAGGRELSEADGGPCLYDMDSDGNLDLVLGGGMGALNVYYGKPGSVDLRAGESILKNDNNAWQPRRVDRSTGTIEGGRPGVRIKPYVCDWNGDGKMDILAGDYLSIQPAPRKLTAEQAARLKRLKSERDTLITKLQQASQQAIEKARKVSGKSGTNRGPTPLSQNKAFVAVRDRYMKVYQAIDGLEARAESGGYVWVLLGR
jgi:hypothetical protein